MNLTPEQKDAVAGWVAAGDNLSAVQKKLTEKFSISMTYRDVRFLVDDLNLDIKDPAPKADASDVSKVPAAKAAAPADRPPGRKGFLDKAKEKLGLAKGEAPAEDDAVEEPEFAPEDEAAAGGAGAVSISVDKVTLLPGAVASGTVTFSDGVTGKWIVDNYGRPALTDVSKPGYRPSPADAQAFMQELGMALQRKGL